MHPPPSQQKTTTAASPLKRKREGGRERSEEGSRHGSRSFLCLPEGCDASPGSSPVAFYLHLSTFSSWIHGIPGTHIILLKFPYPVIVASRNLHLMSYRRGKLREHSPIKCPGCRHLLSPRIARHPSLYPPDSFKQGLEHAKN